MKFTHKAVENVFLRDTEDLLVEGINVPYPLKWDYAPGVDENDSDRKFNDEPLVEEDVEEDEEESEKI